jgi:hypothetical protein
MEQTAPPRLDDKSEIIDDKITAPVAEPHRNGKTEEGEWKTESKTATQQEDKPQSSGGLSKLTAEQLLDYVKKQNIKMKKLKSENEALQKTTLALNGTINDLKSKAIETGPSLADSSVVDGSSYNLFWDLIDRRPPWQQKLAKLSLVSMVGNLTKLSPATGASSSVRRAFHKWVLAAHSIKTESVQASLEESKKANGLLEQRWVIVTGVLVCSVELLLIIV